MRPLVPDAVARLKPYIAGRDGEDVRREFGLDRVIKLASNENPLGPSPLAVEAIRKAASSVHIYPNGGRSLSEVLAQRFGVRTENVITGNGSEGIMSNIIRTFLCDDDEILTMFPTFVGIRVLAEGRGVTYRTVPTKNWMPDLDALAAEIRDETKIIYLANPNNPTGTAFTRVEFERFYAQVPRHVLIILDEAYFEYAQSNPLYPDSLHYRYDNVITLRTFSKAYGLAGVRIGYGFAHSDLIATLLKVKLPFEPSSLAQAAGIAGLNDTEHLSKTIELNRLALSFLTTSLQQIGFVVVPSQANFVLTALSSEKEALAMYESLLRQGLILRWMGSFGLPHCLRISTGTMEDMHEAVELMSQITGVRQYATSGRTAG